MGSLKIEGPLMAGNLCQCPYLGNDDGYGGDMRPGEFYLRRDIFPLVLLLLSLYGLVQTQSPGKHGKFDKFSEIIRFPTIILCRGLEAMITSTSQGVNDDIVTQSFGKCPFTGDRESIDLLRCLKPILPVCQLDFLKLVLNTGILCFRSTNKNQNIHFDHILVFVLLHTYLFQCCCILLLERLRTCFSAVTYLF